ncbi:mitochondrial 54S ribosomal protein rml2 [Coemansia sp. RSA 2167]|nr:mitochondrial 54S ribosomal protein rml2 [Coemansia sp. RSA 2167]KAJ2145363.1 mitochondrial 54S ribosomal protein rml2 [Coemansia sp. RSA 637]KAJ2167377.1 mitochondrial 54S ribosomal protein rml2 [Coemansia sp. RSA 562]KAJ2170262.1 mitochondrial 54S ribosomal protein rml2 [Coemansia sp. RSA 560]KAJ2197272.1 mitochondrial 54S ribosomal protein rml2 [Coemansia sp. RSA 522]KAJ2282605.1 mitochondrial 54S ribosomal protein rml2 [Coemansia sp. RSA 370]KAJ2289638.1 mitochondrial 54S ribosomal pro
MFRLALQRVSAAVGSKLRPISVGQQQVRFMGNTIDDGQFKTWKPLAPTLRQRRMTSRKHLHKGGPVRELTVAKRRTGGRNNTGRITCRHRGGGAKRRIRLVDFRRKETGPQQVIRLEYDPGRSAHIALIKHMETGKLSYILAPVGLKPGAIVQSFMGESKPKSAAQIKEEEEAAAAAALAAEAEARAQFEESLAEDAETDAYGKVESIEVEGAQEYTSEGLKHQAASSSRASLVVGNCMPLKMVPIGTIIHNIGLHPFGRAQLARSAGASVQLLYTAPTGLAQIKMMSGEIRRVPVEACATLGRVSNANHKNQKLGGAGARRRRGWRPTVRGTAMNTHDHPHGGGRGKSKGNKHPRSPWGKPAKGGKTRRKPNPMVVRARPRR